MVRLALELESELASVGYGIAKTFDLTVAPLAFCQGEFDCWVKTPGRCRSKDVENDIVAAVRNADTLVLLGPVTFGGHGYVLKRAVDRLICLLEPFFTRRLSLTHHSARYERMPRFLCVGWAHEPSAEITLTFEALNDANAINFLAPKRGALVLDDAHADGWAAEIRGMLLDLRTPGAILTARPPLTRALFAATAPDPDAPGPARVVRAALLVGSAKAKGTSASEAMARALVGRLNAASVVTELHFATEFVHDDQWASLAAASIASCDLFVLVSPLYVDSLPALATHALELVARARGAAKNAARFVALVNCGFPEPEHTRTAFRMARHFAEQAGYAWGGGLPLGGGGVVAPDRPLDAPHGLVAHVVRALDLVAPALASGHPLPQAAIATIAASPLPEVAYRLIADLGWRWRARQNGLAHRDLHARPLDLP